MRFARFELKAFGHFSDQVLDFAGPRPGFHLIYGNNEAGKSTALRAIRGFLYGIPHQSRDTFVHAGGDLLLAAEMIDPSGARLYALRRKGRKNTLLDADGAPLNEGLLQKTIVDENLFSAMFGLDHETLRHGAQELLAGKAGESLFGAGMGTGSVRKLLAELKAGAEELFVAKGRSRIINQQIAELKEARQSVQNQSTSAGAYVAREQTLRGSSERLDTLLAERNRTRVERSRLERQLRVLMPLAQRERHLAQLAGLGPVPEIPADAEERRIAAERGRDHARQTREHEQVEIDRAALRLAGLEVDPALLDLEPQLIDELSLRLGQHRKAQLDLPKRQGELKSLEDEVLRDLRALGSELPIDRVEELRLTEAEESRLRRLSREKTQFDTKLEDTAAKFKRLQDAVARRRKEAQRRTETVDPSVLRIAVLRAQKAAGSEQQLAEARKRIARLDQRINQAQSGLGGYTGQASQLASLPVPSASTLQRFEEERIELEHEQAEQRRAGATLEERLIELRRDQTELQATGEVPTRARLLQLRQERDAAFEVVGERGATPEHVARVRVQIALADEFADRIHREADRVSKLAQLEASLEANSTRTQRLVERRAGLETRQATYREAWAGVWAECQVRAGSPREMSDWLRRRDELLELLDERDRAVEAARDLEGHLADVAIELSAALEQAGESPRQLWESKLTALTERAESALAARTAASVAGEDALRHLRIEEEQLNEAEEDQRELKEQEKRWRTDWTKALKSIRLERDAGPDEVQAVLRRLSEVFHKLQEVRALGGRISGMRRDSEELEKRVRAVLSVGAPSAMGQPWEEACEQLVREARRARTRTEESDRLRGDLEQRVVRRDKAVVEEQHAQAELDGLMVRAGAKDLPGLRALEETAARARDLRRQIGDREDEVVRLGDGQSLDELITQTRGMDADVARDRIERLEADLAVQEDSLDQLRAEIATAEQELERFEAGAVKAAEELAACTAALRGSVAEYVRRRLASALLSSEVERYRAEHQGPVLERASLLFPRLTLGAYAGLSVGYDGKDDQILLCVRDDGRQVGVADLSDGARDQLYLSLRLASLQHYLEGRDPMPLVLDDVLIHFDDTRAEAALRVIGELADTVQVLFFTHHQRVLELAQRAVPAELLTTHVLGTAPGRNRVQVA